MKNNALHSAATCEWGTPPDLVKHSRYTLGSIDLDPCSSVEWNMNVGAWRIITQQEDCRITPWVIGGPLPLRNEECPRGTESDFYVHINPPGDPKGELVAFCWKALANYFHTRWISAAVWIGFSIEQLARLQRITPDCHPLLFPTLILAARPSFMKRPGVAGTQPSHAGFMTLIGGDSEMVRRFVDSKHLGTVTMPYSLNKTR